MTMTIRELEAMDRNDLPVVAAPSFALGLWRIAAADVSSGNRVALLRDGPATFDAMVELIDAATSTVALETYILRSDEVGHRIGDALIRAPGRGALIRLLLDWFGMRGIARAFLRQLRAAGIDVAVFNPPGFRVWLGIFPRDHRKLLVVDGAIGITGGLNIGREWTTGI